MGNELSDTHINMAQNPLKAQFRLLNGLKSIEGSATDHYRLRDFKILRF